MRLIRYRFKTKAVDDNRPLINMEKIQMPWWCSAEACGWKSCNYYLLFTRK